jgi:hypothetical protein
MFGTLMPRFSHAVLACLKKVMLSRAPGYFFTCHDVDLLVGQTGLDSATILHWADNLRWKSRHGMLADVGAFLASSDGEQKVT